MCVCVCVSLSGRHIDQYVLYITFSSVEELIWKWQLNWGGSADPSFNEL